MYPLNWSRARSRYAVSTSVRLFFPRRLDPVLDRRERDEHTMISPHVPGSGAVRETVLDHQPDGQLLNPTGVEALGCGEVGHVGRETDPAGPAPMAGIGEVDLDRAVGLGVTHVEQVAEVGIVARGRVAAPGAGTVLVHPAAMDDPRGWEFLDPGDPFGTVGHVFARSEHGFVLPRRGSAQKVRPGSTAKGFDLVVGSHVREPKLRGLAQSPARHLLQCPKIQ
jgi:hypothetical protein